MSLPNTSIHLPAARLLIGLALALGAGCRTEAAVVPFGPGLIVGGMPSAPVAVGARIRLSADWAANTPVPAMQVTWKVEDPSIVAA